MPPEFLRAKPPEFEAWTIGVVTLVEAANVVNPVAAPVSPIVTTEFCNNLPVVLSNLAIALSVALAGPTTSPPKDGEELVITPVVLS